MSNVLHLFIDVSINLFEYIMKNKTTVMLVFFVMFLACGVPTVSFRGHYTVSLSPDTMATFELARLLESGAPCTIIDVRDADAYDDGHITNAFSLPYENLCWSCGFDALIIDERNPVVVAGDDSQVVRDVARSIQKTGIGEVFVLVGGLSEWLRAGLIIQRTSSMQEPITIHATGCIPLENYDVPTTPVSVLTDLPSAWDWRKATFRNITGDWTTPVKSQGACGSCWAFGGMGALEAAFNLCARNPSFDIDLSEQYLLSCPPSSGGCSGWNAYQAYWYLFNNGGAIPEACFPYQADDSIPCADKCDDWQDRLMPMVAYHAISNAERDEIKSALLTYGPVVTEMAVFGDFGSYEGGVYEHPGDESPRDINHQVVIVGYSDEGQYWICKNSWGSWWGEDGFFRIAYGDCQIEHFIIYVECSPAIARVSTPLYTRSGESLTLDGSASESLTSSISSYAWNFGDGNTGSGTAPTHIYREEGLYFVTLTVTDGEGNTGTIKTRVYVDDTAPTITFANLQKNRFYYYGEDKGYVPFRSVIIGFMTASFETDDDRSGVAGVEVYFDRQLLAATIDKNIEWFWPDAPFGFHRLDLYVSDRAGNTASETIKLFTWMAGE
jgi:rhodanese-related sulfurtransferase